MQFVSEVSGMWRGGREEKILMKKRGHRELLSCPSEMMAHESFLHVQLEKFAGEFAR